MSHEASPSGPLPPAAQAPYPPHPAPQPHHEAPAAPGRPHERTAVAATVSGQAAKPREARTSFGRGWLIAAGAGIGVALTAALLPLLARRPAPPKPHKRKKVTRHRK